MVNTFHFSFRPLSLIALTVLFLQGATCEQKIVIVDGKVQEEAEEVSPEASPEHMITAIPADGASGVAVTTNIRAIFKPELKVEADTLTAQNVFLLEGGINPLPIALSFDEGVNTLSIDGGTLQAGIKYSVILTDNVKVDGDKSLGSVLRGLQANGGSDQVPTNPVEFMEPNRHEAPPSDEPSAFFMPPDEVDDVIVAGDTPTGTSISPDIIAQFPNLAFAWSFITAAPAEGAADTETDAGAPGGGFAPGGRERSVPLGQVVGMKNEKSSPPLIAAMAMPSWHPNIQYK